MRHALRSLLRTPGFTLTAVLTLALGIGATTTVFSWVDRVLLHPLPGVADPGRMLALETRTPSGEFIDTSYPDFRDYQAQAKSFSHLLVHKERPLNLGAGADAERVWAEMVSGNFFDALGVRPRLGRFFLASDRADDPAAAPVVVLSEALWRRRFHADPGILGRTVKLNQHDFTVIGIAPASFLGVFNGLAFDVWVPLATHARLLGPSRWLETRGWSSLHTLGRLAPGATLETARAELATIAARIGAAHPERPAGLGLIPMPVTDSPHGAHKELARPLLLLLGVAGLLLLIVCANLSNLLLVRASARQREMCIRQALGAGAWRLLRQLLAESFLLSAAGTLVGLLITWWMSDLLRGFLPDATLPISLASGLSLRVLLLAVALSTLTALLAGIAPALWALRPNLIDVLRASGRAAATLPRAEFFRRTLIVAQVALALVTLACASLAAKSFFAVKHADPGFDASGVLLAALKLDTSGYTRAEAAAFLDRLQPRLAALPGIASAAFAEDVPLGFSRGSWEEIAVPGYVPAKGEDLRLYRNLISPGYFSLMRIPLLGGRDFNDADKAGAPFVAMINETFARRYFGSAEAVGRTFTIWGDRVLTVVGVVRDIKTTSIGENARPYFYVPLRQFYSLGTGIAIHLRDAAVQGDPLLHLPALRAAVRELDPPVPIFEAVTLEDYVSAARYAQKSAASLLGVLSVIALALTSLGLYGVLAFAVAQRTPEFGVRLALGAQSSDIARLVLTRGFALVGLGLLLGLLGAAGVARGLAALFYGISPFEPTLLALAVIPVLLAAFVACYLPARHATQIDPMTALRTE
ncbi:MAG: ABC transporter permease [Verrucomicrobiota bacterium]